MSSIFGILATGTGALAAQQKAIEVAAQNIANVNTPGYSRRRLVLETNSPILTSAGQIGTGVTATGVERIYDRFLDNQIIGETEDLGRWEAQRSGLERVEAILNEAPGYGLNQDMSEFWNSWQDLANNPEGYTERVTLLAKSETLAYNFEQTYNDLKGLRADLDSGIEDTVSLINIKAGQIAELNEKIAHIETAGDNANEYRDQRTLLLNELALTMDISTTEQSSGSVTVTVGGQTLVDGASHYDLSTVDNPSNSNLNDIYIDTTGDGAGDTNITGDISGGKLKGWLDVRDVAVTGYMADFNNLVSSIKGAEVTNVTAGAESTLAGGEHFNLSSTSTDYYVWYDIDGGSTDPSVGGRTGIKVDIAGGDSADEVAAKTASAIAAVVSGSNPVFDAVASGSTITINNVADGAANDATVGTSGFTVNKATDGGNGINDLHRAGNGLMSGPAYTGNDFFSGSLARDDFAVSSTIAADVNKIAAAGSSDGLPGGNSNAIAISNLQNELRMSGNAVTFDDFYNAVIGDVGTEVEQANVRYSHQSEMVGYLNNCRESISGVSLDEEMANLVQFQHAYEAAAKLISLTDQLLATVINII